MWSTAREVAAGDTVIIWQTRDSIQPLIITPGKDYNSKYGNFRQSDFVGVPYGSKVVPRNGKGYLHILRPTPELWTMALPHRTQILYLADIAFITSWLDIKPGSRVIEAGTGSGSFSHSVVRTIGTTGHLWSYEFHEARANKARAEFILHGMSDTVTLTHRNVCKAGFTVTNIADSVFLDLPAPWDAVGHAKKALRKDRIARICCFSPCIEQVLRTVSALNDLGFTGITMYETLIRPHEVYQIPKPRPLNEIIDKLNKSEQKREDKRQRQIANSRGRSAVDTDNSKRRRDDSADEEPVREDGSKRVKVDDGETHDSEDEFEQVGAQTLDQPSNSGFAGPIDSMPSSSQTKINVSKAMREVRGHTSYLTFACLIPSPPTDEDTKEDEDAKAQEDKNVKEDEDMKEDGDAKVVTDFTS